MYDRKNLRSAPNVTDVCFFVVLMGFIIHFYIIFGTNLLTQGPVQIVVFFLPISVFRRKGISNGVQTE